MLDTTVTRILSDKRLTDGTFFNKFTNLPTSRISILDRVAGSTKSKFRQNLSKISPKFAKS